MKDYGYHRNNLKSELRQVIEKWAKELIETQVANEWECDRQLIITLDSLKKEVVARMEG